MPIEMGPYAIVPYRSDDRELWNRLNSCSRNSTFLLDRGYMDYHSDRFIDASLLINDTKGKTVALFAASRDGDTIIAHGGLTYGGIILPKKGIISSDTVEVFKAIAGFYAGKGVRQIVYKAIPHIYHSQPSEDDIYALFRLGGKLTEVNLSSAIDYALGEVLDSNTRRGAEKARRLGLRVCKSDDLKSFWDVLTELLGSRYGVTPVHSLSEIELLARRFPDNIKLWTVRNHNGEIIAGTVIYDTGIVAHTQYIASSPEGKDSGALHLLFSELVPHFSATRRYLDFGTSNEDHGRRLNAGLIRQKWGCGGRPVAHLTITVDL